MEEDIHERQTPGPLPAIQTFQVEEAWPYLPSLANLLKDAVANGASIGFMASISEEEAHHYWLNVLEEVSHQTRLLLMAIEDDQVIGSVQLALATKPNARHRAEVQKLCVHSSARQRGLGQALMVAVEEAARQLGRSLLVLDTRRGDVAARLYRRQGYTEFGIVPRYAYSPAGLLEDCVFFYKEI